MGSSESKEIITNKVIDTKYSTNIKTFGDSKYFQAVSQLVKECQPNIITPQKRIITIGDIHGDFDVLRICFEELAKVVRVVNDELEWIGGETHVVLTGDLIDRYRPESIIDREGFTVGEKINDDYKVLMYVDIANDLAKKFGGKVIRLSGNHEQMILDRQYNYVSRQYKDKRAHREIITQLLGCNKVAVQIGKWLFMHGGFWKPDFWDIYEGAKDGILWNRDYGDRDPDRLICPSSFREATAEEKDVKIVIGHTTQYEYKKIDTLTNIHEEKNGVIIFDGRLEYVDLDRIRESQNKIPSINAVCGGSVWRIDVGMSRAMDAEESDCKEYVRRLPQVLEILNNNETRIIMYYKDLEYRPVCIGSLASY